MHILKLNSKIEKIFSKLPFLGFFWPKNWKKYIKWPIFEKNQRKKLEKIGKNWEKSEKMVKKRLKGWKSLNKFKKVKKSFKKFKKV